MATPKGPSKHEGWMTKKGQKRTNWNKRWFVLEDGKLSYYKEQSNTSAPPLGVLDIKDKQFTESGNAKYPNRFEIFLPERTFSVYTETRHEFLEWREKFKEHGALWKEPEKSTARIRSPTVSTSESNIKVQQGSNSNLQPFLEYSKEEDIAGDFFVRLELAAQNETVCAVCKTKIWTLRLSFAARKYCAMCHRHCCKNHIHHFKNTMLCTTCLNQVKADKGQSEIKLDQKNDEWNAYYVIISHSGILTIWDRSVTHNKYQNFRFKFHLREVVECELVPLEMKKALQIPPDHQHVDCLRIGFQTDTIFMYSPEKQSVDNWFSKIRSYVGKWAKSPSFQDIHEASRRLLQDSDKCNKDKILQACKMGVDVNECQETTRLTPLMMCCKSTAEDENSAGCVRVLLQHRARVNDLDSEGRTALHHAVAKNKLATIKALCEDPTLKVFVIDRTGCTPLRLAQQNQYTVISDELIGFATRKAEMFITGSNLLVQDNVNRGVDLNFQNNIGDSILHLAIAASAKNIRDLTSRMECDVNIRNMDGTTPLHLACRLGQASTVRALLERNADPTLPNHAGELPLHIAVEYCSVECVTLLLRHHAYPKMINVQRRNDGSTPLHIAMTKDNQDIVESLLKADPDLSLKDGTNKLARDIGLVKNSASYQTLLRFENGRKLLEYCRNVEIIAVRNILDKGADVNFTDGDQYPLHIACLKRNIELVKLLIRHGAKLDVKNNDNKTPAMVAQEVHKHEAVDSEIEQALGVAVIKDNLFVAAERGLMDTLHEYRNQDPNEVDPQGRTALTIASQNGQEAFIEQFLLVFEGRVNLAALDRRKRTALHWASYEGHKGCVEKLLAHNRSLVDQSDGNDDTALDLAFQRYHDHVMEVLLDYGASTQKYNVNNLSSDDEKLKKCQKLIQKYKYNKDLHIAVSTGQLREVINLIESKGADVNWRDKQNGGRTPLHVAAMTKHADIYHILIKHHANEYIADDEGKLPKLESIAEQQKREDARQAILKSLRENATLDEFEYLQANCDDDDLGGTDLNQRNLLHYLCEKEVPLGYYMQRIPNKQDLINAQDNKGNTPLHLAASKNVSESVSVLLSYGADIGIFNDFKHKPIDRAHSSQIIDLLIAAENAAQVFAWARTGDTSKLDSKILYGLDPNARNMEGETPLHVAVKNNCQKFAEILLTRVDANIHTPDKAGRTPLDLAKSNPMMENILLAGESFQKLIAACERGDAETVKECVKNHPRNINQPTLENFTALHVLVVAEFRARELQKVFPGADIQACAEAVLEMKPRFSPAFFGCGLTPLHLAAMLGCDLITKTFLEHLKDRPASEKFQKTTSLTTELHLAIAVGSCRCLKLLLDHGADPNSTDSKNNTPLITLAETPSIENSVEQAKLLVSKGAKIDATNNKKQTALARAIKYSNMPLALYLLEQGADPNTKEENDSTPLMRAIERESAQLVEVLIQKGAVPSSALHMAAFDGKTECLRLMLKAPKVDPNETLMGLTPLLCAVINNHLDCVNLLLFHGAQIDASVLLLSIKSSREIVTALQQQAKTNYLIHEIANREHDSAFLAKILTPKSYGDIVPDVNFRDANGKGPVYYALFYNRTEYLKVLFDFGANIELDSLKQDDHRALHKKYQNGKESFEQFKRKVSQGSKDQIEEFFRNDSMAFTRSQLIDAWHLAILRHPFVESIADLFLEYGAVDVNSFDGNGQTALHKACDVKDGLEAIKYLVQRPDLHFQQRDKWGKTAWHYASKQANQKFRDTLQKFYPTEKQKEIQFTCQSDDGNHFIYAYADISLYELNEKVREKYNKYMVIKILRDNKEYIIDERVLQDEIERSNKIVLTVVNTPNQTNPAPKPNFVAAQPSPLQPDNNNNTTENEVKFGANVSEFNKFRQGLEVEEEGTKNKEWVVTGLGINLMDIHKALEKGFANTARGQKIIADTLVKVLRK